jgi:prolipoprotein diacylglyceryl transferase
MLIHWQADPVLLQLGPLALRWYGLLFVGAFLVGQWMLARLFRAEGVPAAQAERLLLWALLGTVLGARLVHVLFYDPAYYAAHPLAVLRIWEGGLASHGGAIGLVLALWWGAHTAVPRLPVLWLVDRATIPSAFGAVLVRTANFVNSEIVGKPTAGGWGVVFDAIDPVPRHPVQLYEALGYLLTFGVLLALYRRRGAATPHGWLFGWFLVLVFGVRLVAEHFKVPQAAYEAGQLLSVGQWLSLPFVGAGLALLWWSARRPVRAAPTGSR